MQVGRQLVELKPLEQFVWDVCGILDEDAVGEQKVLYVGGVHDWVRVVVDEAFDKLLGAALQHHLAGFVTCAVDETLLGQEHNFAVLRVAVQVFFALEKYLNKLFNDFNLSIKRFKKNYYFDKWN